MNTIESPPYRTILYLCATTVLYCIFRDGTANYANTIAVALTVLLRILSVPLLYGAVYNCCSRSVLCANITDSSAALYYDS